MLGQRLLLVDDDKNVLITMGAILKRHGFQVTSASSVSEAIHEITKQTFDILVTDLNIGEPSDGFTVVSAMRRMQPDAAALIITGFPAFDNALQAIRQQVDDYLVKPIPPADLLATIEKVRQTRSTHVPFATSRISAIVRANSHQIQTRWLAELKNYAKSIGRADLDDASLLNHLSSVIEEISNRVDENRTSTSTDAKKAATAHGLLRRQQQLSPTFILNEGTHLREEVLHTIHLNLLHVDLSTLLTDLTTMSDSLDDQLKFSMEAHLAVVPQIEVLVEGRS
jgi:ActR/RegA family two-component response regulator